MYNLNRYTGRPHFRDPGRITTSKVTYSSYKYTRYATVRNTLKKRHQTRKIWINTTTEICKTYIDEGGNFQFNEFYLEEKTEESQTAAANVNAPEQLLVKMLEKLIENSQQKSETRSLGKIAKEFTIEKFNGKNSNAHQWISEFVKECERFDIT